MGLCRRGREPKQRRLVSDLLIKLGQFSRMKQAASAIE